jgi:hypothetical protein
MVGRIGTVPVASIKYLLSVSLAGCLAVFVVCSLSWPLIGDAALLHYAVLLIDRGAVPYRDIAEMNMPGSYLVEWIGIHAFGGGDLAWRLFDLALTAIATAAMVVIALPVDWFAGIWAGSLLVLVHGRDGILELGQRDLSLAVLLLAGYACLFLSLRLERPTLSLLFGAFTGLAATIKPTVLLLGPLSLCLVYLQFRYTSRAGRFLLAGLAGLLAPWIAAIVFLWRDGAMRAFLGPTLNMVAYHTSLARRPLGYLLLHSVAPLLPLTIAWLIVLCARRSRPDWEHMHLWLALGFGLVSYLYQAKGYSYQRYPFLAFLLLLMAMDFLTVWKLRENAHPLLRVLVIAGLAYGALFLAPVSTAMTLHYDGKNLGNIGMLEQDLRDLGAARLAGGVQCVDSIDGCTNVLYRMRLTEISQTFYDEFLFGPDSVSAVRENRKKFWSDLEHSPPAVIVVTGRSFFTASGAYQKLSRWPEFDSYLHQNYSICLERTPRQPVRWWSKPEIPVGYRIYLRNQTACPVR